jgi:hypothetical protein
LSIGFLKIFKISNNHLNFFNLSLLTNKVYLEELDLNGNNLVFDKINTENLLHNVKIINLNNVKFLDSNSTFNENWEYFKTFTNFTIGFIIY